MIITSPFSGRILLVLPLLLIFACAPCAVAEAQAVPGLPGNSNPLSLPGSSLGSDAIPLSSGMLVPFLPGIPNLELGFLYYFGNNVRTARFTADYVLPFRLSYDSVLFGEAHAEGWGFWKKPSVSVAAAPGFTVTTSDASNRVDLSFGGGYRTMLGANTLFGVSGFCDTSHLFNKWYSSGGVGLEFAANIAGDDAMDLNFNWYGNLFNRDVLVDAFRNKGNSFDAEAGYSHALFSRSLDLRFKLIGYQFDIGTAVQGWRGGADLTTRDGVFTVRYEYGHDRVNGSYNAVGGFVTLGLQLENLLTFDSPFTLPEPVFKSPRDLRRLLGLKVKRNWHQSRAIVAAGPATACTNLSGITFHIASLSEGDQLLASQPIPPITASTVTICWCGALGSSTLCLLITDELGNTVYTIQDVNVSQGSGCQQVHTVPASSPPPNSLTAFCVSPSPLNFSPGGGISVSFP